MARRLKYPHVHTVRFDDASEKQLKQLAELSKKEIGQLCRELIMSGLALVNATVEAEKQRSFNRLGVVPGKRGKL